jgi:hypothetical protein
MFLPTVLNVGQLIPNLRSEIKCIQQANEYKMVTTQAYFSFIERGSPQFTAADSTVNPELYEVDSRMFPICTVVTAVKVMC